MSGFNRWLAPTLRLAAALVLFVMMIYTFVDVISRYFFNSPLAGGLELTELAMALLIFSGLPLVTAADQHIAVDILDNIWPTWVRRVQRAVIPVIGAAVALVLCWRIVVNARDTAQYGDVTSTLAVPLAPFVWFMAVMMGITSLIFLLKAVDSLTASSTPPKTQA